MGIKVRSWQTQPQKQTKGVTRSCFITPSTSFEQSQPSPQYRLTPSLFSLSFHASNDALLPHHRRCLPSRSLAEQNANDEQVRGKTKTPELFCVFSNALYFVICGNLIPVRGKQNTRNVTLKLLFKVKQTKIFVLQLFFRTS